MLVRLLSIELKICVRTPLVRCQIYFGLDPTCIRRMRSNPKIAKNGFLALTRILSILQKKGME
ncbi:hypothetical protein TSAR_015122 [Trichomalopsis sarcophagae]|uniref:Uncharacterized protein n=1 Tax=Trichomalopsis sarcophagae TaxID=543379 RepID=A0A232EH72_9HYME|nr:hypothetical protein TSAR_015122 [Trichomalopsis sarcophagae]